MLEPLGAKEKLDLNAPTLGFKSNPGFAPPGFKPVFVGAVPSQDAPILSAKAPSWSSVAGTDASGFIASYFIKAKEAFDSKDDPGAYPPANDKGATTDRTNLDSLSKRTSNRLFHVGRREPGAARHERRREVPESYSR